MPEKPKPKVTHAAVKKQQRRSQGGGWAWVALPVIGAVAIVALAVWGGNRNADVLKNVVPYPDQGHFHLASLAQKHDPYNSDPPTSGPHLPGIYPWGFYDNPVPPEYLVHNMEDAGVVIYYKPGADAALKQRLKDLQQQRPNNVIVVPGSASQSEDVILTAWTVMLREPKYDDLQTKAFIQRYAGIDHHIQGSG